MMPEFRHPEIFQKISWREWIRKHIPPGREGYVAEDLDLIMRHFTPEDPVGKFMLLEFKYGESRLDTSQRRTLGLIDTILRKGDPRGLRYTGFYLVQYPEGDFEKCTYVKVNGNQLSMDDFARFLKFELRVEPYRLEEVIKGED